MMDLSLVFLLLLHSFLILPFLFQETEADQDPFSKFAEYLNTNDVKEDIKRRRKTKHGRVQPISLKPPPKDWPEPVMAAGDFIMAEESEGTSLSPLLAYQAKLEQEYARQNQVNLQQDLTKSESEQTQDEAELTSSEEDLKKLLDPGELLKHNKQLRPFLNQGKDLKPLGGGRGPNAIQGKATKLAGISSLTALKAKTDAKRSKKAKSGSSKITTTMKPRRGRRKKTEGKSSDSRTPYKETKKKRIKSILMDVSQPSNKKRRKRVRTFAFAERKFDKQETTHSKEKKINTELTTVECEDISKTDDPFFTTEISTEVTSNAIISTAEAKTYLPDIEEEPEILSNEITTSKNNTANILFHTPTSTPIENKLDSNSLEVTSATLTETSNIESTSSVLFTSVEGTTGIATSNYTRNQIREKRKEIKQEMEKVLEVEQLEKSFGDTDSGWTSSEEAFYVEYNEMEKSFKKKIEILKKTRTTQRPPTTYKNIYRHIIQLLN